MWGREISSTARHCSAHHRYGPVTLIFLSSCPAGHLERSWILIYEGIKLVNMSPQHCTIIENIKDTCWATHWEEAPHSAPYRSSDIYSNTLIETPPSPPLRGEIKKGCLAKLKRKSCRYGTVLLVAAALLLTHLVPTDVDFLALETARQHWSTRQTLVTNSDCQKNKYTYK